MAHEGEGDARVGAERVVTCGINTINNTTDREGCREGWGGECKPKPKKKVVDREGRDE